MLHINMYVCECICSLFFNFLFQPAKVTVHWHKGTCFMIKFDESVIARDKMIDSR